MIAASPSRVMGWSSTNATRRLTNGSAPAAFGAGLLWTGFRFAGEVILVTFAGPLLRFGFVLMFFHGKFASDSRTPAGCRINLQGRSDNVGAMAHDFHAHAPSSLPGFGQATSVILDLQTQNAGALGQGDVYPPRPRVL